MYQSKQITKKVCNSIIKSISLNYTQIYVKMNTIFMNSESHKRPKWHVLTLKLTSKLDLKIGEKVITWSNLSIYYTWKNVKASYNNNRLKISAPTWNGKFELPDGSCSVSDIQDYFKYLEYFKSILSTKRQNICERIWISVFC